MSCWQNAAFVEEEQTMYHAICVAPICYFVYRLTALTRRSRVRGCASQKAPVQLRNWGDHNAHRDIS